MIPQCKTISVYSVAHVYSYSTECKTASVRYSEFSVCNEECVLNSVLTAGSLFLMNIILSPSCLSVVSILRLK